MLFELLPLLEAAASSANRPMIVSSIRDIMQEGRKQKRVDESVDLVSKYFDLVMVHGDPEFISIEETLQGAGQFQEKIRYTGLVTPNLAASEMTTQKRYDVIASVGGGAFGRELLDCVLDTAGKLADSGGRWLVSAGSELSEVDFRQLANEAPDNIDLVKHIADFASAMMEAEVSISHSGYNTVADILRTGCKSVLYPHTGGRETEQLRRAEKLDQLGYAHMIEPGKLTPGTLGKAIEKARQSSARAISLDLEGASQTAEILHAEYSRWQGNP